MDLDYNDLVAALRRTRIGHVTRPNRGEEASQQDNESAVREGCRLSASVPHWLISELERSTAALRLKLEVFAAAYDDELWALLIIQRAQVQLRLVLPLDDSGAQTFIRHGLLHRRICLALDVENTDSTVHVVFEAGLGDADALEDLLARARARDGALTRLVQLTEMMSAAGSAPSLEPAYRAADVVAVLVSNRAHELVEAATGLPPHRR